MSSEAAQRAVGYRDAMQRMLDLHAEPLAQALGRGEHDGSLTSSDPYLDARSVLAIVEIVGERFGLSEEEKAAIYGVVGDPYVAAFDLIRHRLNPTGTYGSWSPRTLGLPPPTQK